MEDAEEAQYFLGIRITRDRKNRRLNLCQDVYIEKAIKTFGLENCDPVTTLL
jgi:hypothetical protein